ncbi:MAG: alkaline phosphatase PhoX, partial [Myxococcota bacterium]
MSEYNRREFLEFMGYGAAAAALVPPVFGCTKSSPKAQIDGLPFTPLSPTRSDSLTLAKGFESRIVLSHGQALNDAGARFGYNNDYIELFPVPGVSGPDELLMWVNHESVEPKLLHSKGWKEPLSREEVSADRKEVGGSLARIRRSDGEWQLVNNDSLNRRIDGTTPIPLVGGRPIAGERVATGTLANCAGGKTPWGTLLTCEENFDNFYPPRTSDGWALTEHPHWWHLHYDRPSEHYGWVVEVNP